MTAKEKLERYVWVSGFHTLGNLWKSYKAEEEHEKTMKRLEKYRFVNRVHAWREKVNDELLNDDYIDEKQYIKYQELLRELVDLLRKY